MKTAKVKGREVERRRVKWGETESALPRPWPYGRKGIKTAQTLLDPGNALESHGEILKHSSGFGPHPQTLLQLPWAGPAYFETSPGDCKVRTGLENCSSRYSC